MQKYKISFSSIVYSMEAYVKGVYICDDGSYFIAYDVENVGSGGMTFKDTKSAMGLCMGGGTQINYLTFTGRFSSVPTN